MSNPRQVVVLAGDPVGVLQRLGDVAPDVSVVHDAAEATHLTTGVLLISGPTDAATLEAVVEAFAPLPGVDLALDLLDPPSAEVVSNAGLGVVESRWFGGIPALLLGPGGAPFDQHLLHVLAGVVPSPRLVDDETDRLRFELVGRSRELEAERIRGDEARADVVESLEANVKELERERRRRRTTAAELAHVRSSPALRLAALVGSARRRPPHGRVGIVVGAVLSVVALAVAVVAVAEVGRYAFATVAVLTLVAACLAPILVLRSLQSMSTELDAAGDVFREDTYERLRRFNRTQQRTMRAIEPLAEAQVATAQQLARIEAALVEARSMLASQDRALDRS